MPRIDSSGCYKILALDSCRGAGPVVSEPVEPYFIRFLRVLTFCLGVSNGVAFCGNGVVNGVVE